MKSPLLSAAVVGAITQMIAVGAFAASPVANSWAGFYIGANGGYGWTDRTVTYSPNDPESGFIFDGLFGSTPPNPTALNSSGGLGGLQAGYNWQLNQIWLLGLEADFDWSGIRGNGTSNFLLFPVLPPGGPSNMQASQNIDWFGTIRGRFGFSPTANTLFYGTAGFAYGRVSEQVSLNAPAGTGGVIFGYSCDASNNCFLGSSSRIETGWTVGGGLEYAPWNNNITVKIEYLFVNLGADTVNVIAQDPIGPQKPSSISGAYNRTELNVVRAGLNYKFN